MERLQLSENVWYFPMDPDLDRVQPVVGAVITERQTVLIDCGNSPSYGRSVLRTLEDEGAPPVSTIIYTHHHWDHTWGACAFDASTEIIGHERTVGLMEEMAQVNWGREYLEEQMRLNPASERFLRARLNAVDGEDAFRIVLPTRTFQDRLTLDVDGLVIELEHVRGVHAEDSIIVRVPEQGVLFVADCFYPRPGAARLPGENPYWEWLQQLGGKTTRWYVHGHGYPLTPEHVQQFKEQNKPDLR